jgi:hypothetical protein
MPISDRLPPKFRETLRFLDHHRNAVLFIAGFLFDFLTMQRIDSWTDLAIQLLYLGSLTFLLVYEHREHRGLWTPPPRLARLWSYNVDALHFFYGGLLSAYVVLYFKSSTGARPVVFFVFLVALMFINEMPQIRRYGYRLRLGLYAFCVVSFLNYFFPILIGRMGAWVFFLAVAGAGGVVWKVASLLARNEAEPKLAQRRLFVPAAALLAVISFLYVLRLIPPVPLSVQFQGIYHNIEKQDGRYSLVYERPPFFAFWRRDSRPFRRRPGDRLFYFARVFAPSRFRHQITVRWEYLDEKGGGWKTADLVPMTVAGGRAEGFRAVTSKDNFAPGRWRVTAETEDGRAIGLLTFVVKDDARTRERRWKSSRA